MEPSGDRTTTTWNYENRTMLVQLPSGIRNTMAYEPGGLRVKLEESSGTKKFVWDEQNYLAETDENDDTQVVYTNEPRRFGNLISQRRGMDSHWYHFDAIGSTRELTDPAATVTDTRLYDAWGIVAASSGSTPFSLRYIGALGYFHHFPFIYVRSRNYSSISARWTAVDRHEFVGGLNRYTYAANRPVDRTDASGFQVDGDDLSDIVPELVDFPAGVTCYSLCKGSSPIKEEGRLFVISFVTGNYCPNPCAEPGAGSPFEIGIVVYNPTAVRDASGRVRCGQPFQRELDRKIETGKPFEYSPSTCGTPEFRFLPPTERDEVTGEPCHRPLWVSRCGTVCVGCECTPESVQLAIHGPRGTGLEVWSLYVEADFQWPPCCAGDCGTTAKYVWINNRAGGAPGLFEHQYCGFTFEEILSRDWSKIRRPDWRAIR